jgi:hypothetical protein
LHAGSIQQYLKQISAIFLIALLVLPAWGTYLFLHALKNQAKSEAMALVSKKEMEADLVTLKFGKEETASLRWEHPGEFEYQGQMYDIMDTRTTADSVIYKCYADHKESRINKAIARTLAGAAGKHHDQQNKNRNLLDFFRISYIPATKGSISSTLPQLSIQHSTFKIQNSTLNPPQPPSPPPKG